MMESKKRIYHWLLAAAAFLLLFAASGCAIKNSEVPDDMNYIGKDLAFTFDVDITDTVVRCSATVTNIGDEKLAIYSGETFAAVEFYDKKWDFYNPFEYDRYSHPVRKVWKLKPGGSLSYALEAPLEGFFSGEYHVEAVFDIAFEEGSGREGFILKQSKKFTIP